MVNPVTARSPRALGQELARLRFDRGLTQQELADELGLTRRYVYELESGRPSLLLTRLFEVLRELGAHLEVVADEPGPGAGADPLADEDGSTG